MRAMLGMLIVGAISGAIGWLMEGRREKQARREAEKRGAKHARRWKGGTR